MRRPLPAGLTIVLHPCARPQLSARYEGVVQQLSDSVQAGLNARAHIALAAAEVLAMPPASETQVFWPRALVRGPNWLLSSLNMHETEIIKQKIFGAPRLA